MREPPGQLTKGSPGRRAIPRRPAIAVDSFGYLHVVWEDTTPGNNEIYYKQSTDGGASWSTNKRLTWTSGSSREPAIAAYGYGILHVIWQDLTTGDYEIYHKVSIAAGAAWSTSKRLTWTPGYSRLPAIAVDSSGNLHMVYQDDTPGNPEIYYKQTTDNGATWSTGKMLSPRGIYPLWDESRCPAIAVDSFGYLHVVWEDNTPGNNEIYYKQSTDTGATWSTNKRLTWTAGDSESPAIAVDSSDNLHLVWHDFTPGNPDDLLQDELEWRSRMVNRPKSHLDFGQFHVSGHGR